MLDVFVLFIFFLSLNLGFGFFFFLVDGLEFGLILNELWREFDLEMDIILEVCLGFLEFNKFYWDFFNGEIWVIILGLIIGLGFFWDFFFILSKVFYCGGKLRNFFVFELYLVWNWCLKFCGFDMLIFLCFFWNKCLNIFENFMVEML